MTDDGLSLLGFFTKKEDAASYARQRLVLRDPSSRGLSDLWKAAKSRLGGPFANAGIPNIQPLPDSKHLQDVLAHPRFPESTLNTTANSFCLVEIAPLFAFQFDVTIDDEKIPTDLVEYCLPTTIKPFALRTEPGAKPNSIRIICDELRFLVLAPAVLGVSPNDFVIGGPVCGSALPWARVARFNGHCYLANGYHRAVRLARAKVTHIPCVLVDVDKFEGIGAKDGGTFPRRYFEGRNPPTCGHFLDRAMPVKIRLRRVEIEIEWKPTNPFLV